MLQKYSFIMPSPNNIEVLFAELDNFQFFC